MPERRAAVRNASSEKQVGAAREREQLADVQFAADLRAILGSPEGIRTFTTLLERWSAFATVFHPDATRMAYRSGQQDVAHELMLLAADVPGALEAIMREKQRRSDEIGRPVRGRKAAPESDTDSSDETESDA